MNCKFLSDVLSSLANPTDHRQYESEEKSENKVIVMWPWNRRVIWLSARQPLNLSTHPAKFGGHGPCGWGNITFSNCHVTTELKCRVIFWDPFMLSKHPAKFGVYGSCESGDILFFICHVTTWLMCHVTLCVGSLILSHHPAKVGVHRPCESEDITFFDCHVTTISKCHVTLWVESPHSKSLPC